MKTPHEIARETAEKLEAHLRLAGFYMTAPMRETFGESILAALTAAAQEQAKDKERLRAALQEAANRLHEIGMKTNSHIPFYAYGDNEAACDMANRLHEIGSLATTAQCEIDAAREQEGKG